MERILAARPPDLEFGAFAAVHGPGGQSLLTWWVDGRTSPRPVCVHNVLPTSSVEDLADCPGGDAARLGLWLAAPGADLLHRDGFTPRHAGWLKELEELVESKA